MEMVSLVTVDDVNAGDRKGLFQGTERYCILPNIVREGRVTAISYRASIESGRLVVLQSRLRTRAQFLRKGSQCLLVKLHGRSFDDIG